MPPASSLLDPFVAATLTQHQCRLTHRERGPTMLMAALVAVTACPCFYRGEPGKWCKLPDSGPLAGAYCMLARPGSGPALPPEVPLLCRRDGGLTSSSRQCPLQRCQEGASYSAWSSCSAPCGGYAWSGGGRQHRTKLVTRCVDAVDSALRCECRLVDGAFVCSPLSPLSPLRFVGKLCRAQTRRLTQTRTCNSRRLCSCTALQRPAFARAAVHGGMATADRQRILRTLAEAGVQLLGAPRCGETQRQLQIACGFGEPALCAALRTLMVDCMPGRHVACARTSELPSWTVPGQQLLEGAQDWAALSAASAKLVTAQRAAASAAPRTAAPAPLEPAASAFLTQQRTPAVVPPLPPSGTTVLPSTMHAASVQDWCEGIFGAKMRGARNERGHLESLADPFDTKRATSVVCSHSGYLVGSASRCQCKCKPAPRGVFYADGADCRW